jgi:hypothetical protein
MANKIQMKKWKLEEENTVFQEQWTEKNCFVGNKGSIICVICKQSVGMPKEYNLRQHFETKHSNFNEKYSGEFRKKKQLLWFRY